MPVKRGDLIYTRARRAPWAPSEILGDEVIQDLVRALARRVSELAGPQHDGRDSPLLDCTERGLRCLLIPIGVDGHESLSPRENEIARMVALGHTNRSIGSMLGISLYTVSAHMRRIFAKLGVSTRAEMIAVLSENPHLRLMPNAALSHASAELGAAIE